VVRGAGALSLRAAEERLLDMCSPDDQTERHLRFAEGEHGYTLHCKGLCCQAAEGGRGIRREGGGADSRAAEYAEDAESQVFEGRGIRGRRREAGFPGPRNTRNTRKTPRARFPGPRNTRKTPRGRFFEGRGVRGRRRESGFQGRGHAEDAERQVFQGPRNTRKTPRVGFSGPRTRGRTRSKKALGRQ